MQWRQEVEDFLMDDVADLAILRRSSVDILLRLPCLFVHLFLLVQVLLSHAEVSTSEESALGLRVMAIFSISALLLT